MIYLDNAATSFPKPRSVIEETEICIKKYCANSGRSSHSLAIRTSEEIYRARECVSDFLSANSPENVCFTANATYALNFAIKGLITKKCHVLISDLEHNSVLRPIHKLHKTKGIDYSVFSTSGDIAENIKKCIKPTTKAIVSTLMSNVSGKEIPLEILSKIAKKHNLLLIVDASQLIGHKKINLSKNPCDALCAPGHKGLFGIQGAGFLVFGKEIPTQTVIEGGSGNESKNPGMPKNLPERMEAGTLPTPSIVALRAGIEYINKLGLHYIEEKNKMLTDIFHESLKQIDGIELFGSENGIISFRFRDKESSEIASELDRFGICIREGLHCSPLAHRTLGSYNTGLIRVSLSIFNKESDAEHLVKALREILF